jgi:hypothetical protein
VKTVMTLTWYILKSSAGKETKGPRENHRRNASILITYCLIVTHRFTLLLEICVWPFKGPLVNCFRRLGGQAYNQHQKRILLEMPMPSLVGLTRGPIRQECTGVFLITYCLIVTHRFTLLLEICVWPFKGPLVNCFTPIYT